MTQEEMDRIRKLIAQALGKHSSFTLVEVLYNVEDGLLVEIEGAQMIQLRIKPV